MKSGFIIIIYLISLTGCNVGRNDPGWDYFPDMFYSTAYESYSENPNFNDDKTMRKPVPGTVSRDYIPFEYGTDIDSRIKAGNELKNPFFPLPENLERGKNTYTIFCALCHGDAGDGNGRLFTMGLYPMKPRPVSGKAAAALKDGEIFHTMTLGLGSMGSYGSQVLPDDRWKVVLYVRQLQSEYTENTNSADSVKTK